LTLGSMSRVEVLAAAQMRVAKTFTSGERSFLGPASGTSVRDCDLRLEVSSEGHSCESGSGVAVVGEKGEVHAVVLVPNGTLVLKPHVQATGSFFARDVSVGEGCNVRLSRTCQAPPACSPPSCDDGNPCTIDRCASG